MQLQMGVLVNSYIFYLYMNMFILFISGAKKAWTS